MRKPFRLRLALLEERKVSLTVISPPNAKTVEAELSNKFWYAYPDGKVTSDVYSIVDPAPCVKVAVVIGLGVAEIIVALLTPAPLPLIPKEPTFKVALLVKIPPTATDDPRVTPPLLLVVKLLKPEVIAGRVNGELPPTMILEELPPTMSPVTVGIVPFMVRVFAPIDKPVFRVSAPPTVQLPPSVTVSVLLILRLFKVVTLGRVITPVPVTERLELLRQ